jgi:hypothetical protein
MTEHAPDRIWSGIDITKTVAGALAAVCAAVVGSFLGVAGTLAGAAIASIVGSLGTEIYARSINRGKTKLQTLAPTFVKAPAAVGTPEVAAATEEDSPSHAVPEELKTDTPRRTIHWKRVALAAGVLFVLAMGSLTMVELVAGRSVASMVGNNSSGTTTVSSVTGGGGQHQTPAPAPSQSATEAPGDEAGTPAEEPGVAPTETPTTTAPTTTPTTEPTTTATTTSTHAPQPTPTGGGQRDEQAPQQGTE